MKLFYNKLNKKVDIKTIIKIIAISWDTPNIYITYNYTNATCVNAI